MSTSERRHFTSRWTRLSSASFSLASTRDGSCRASPPVPRCNTSRSGLPSVGQNTPTNTLAMETAGGGRWRHGVHECARFWPHASNGLPIERIRFVWPPGSTDATALCVQLARRAAGQDQCVDACTQSRTDACPPALSRAHACVPMRLFLQNNSERTLQPSLSHTHALTHTHTHTHRRAGR